MQRSHNTVNWENNERMTRPHTPRHCYFLSRRSTVSVILLIFSCLRNVAYFWTERGFVRLSAACLSVEIYLISISPFSTFLRNQCCLISICLSLVTNLGDSLIMSRTVWRLSQYVVRFWSSWRSTHSKNRLYYKSHIETVVRACNSASVEEVATIVCFLTY